MLYKDKEKEPDISFRSCGLFVSRGEWIHPDRVIDSYEIIFVVSGKVFIREGDTDYILQKNDVLLLSPGVRHFGTKHTRDLSFYWMHFDSDSDFSGKCFSFSDTAALTGLFRTLLHNTNTPFYPPSSATHTVYLILNEIDFLSEKTDDTKDAAFMAAEYVMSNIKLRPTVSDVASHLRYNPDYLSRVFKKAFGQSLRDYISHAIIAKAKLLLSQTGNSVAAVSAELDFENENLFTKFFKYHEGITPTQYISMCYNTHINHK